MNASRDLIRLSVAGGLVERSFPGKQERIWDAENDRGHWVALFVVDGDGVPIGVAGRV